MAKGLMRRAACALGTSTALGTADFRATYTLANWRVVQDVRISGTVLADTNVSQTITVTNTTASYPWAPTFAILGTVGRAKRIPAAQEDAAAEHVPEALRYRGVATA